jgi:hypothetical protein
MKNSSLQLQSINSFLEVYATALQIYDTKHMAFLYGMPCTIISDEKTTVFNDVSRLEGFFNQGAAFYKQFGIVKAVPQIWSRRGWTDRIMNIKVNWQYYDCNGKPIYNCDDHYVLKADKHNLWKIILSVSANEKERMEEWQASKTGDMLIG